MEPGGQSQAEVRGLALWVASITLPEMSDDYRADNIASYSLAKSNHKLYQLELGKILGRR